MSAGGGDMGVLRMTKHAKARLVSIATILLFGVLFSSNTLAAAPRGEVILSPDEGAPAASGEARFRFEGKVMVGEVEVLNLPAQPFGSGRFYGVWFVRTDTGDKAALGALIERESIIFSRGGRGQAEFRATHFTTGPNAGSAITLGAAGKNLFVVLIENKIDGLTPSPVGPVPGTGVAVGGTF